MARDPVGNRMRWTPGKRGHYEGWYVAFNNPEAGRGYWIRYSMVAPSDAELQPVCQSWFMRSYQAGIPRNRAVRQGFPIADLSAADEPFEVRVGENRLHDGGCSGTLGKDIAWDLSFERLLDPIRPTPEWGARMATCYLEPSPLMKVTGTIREGSEETSIDGWLGEQAHVFGVRHSQRWHWAECKHLGAPGRAFTGFAAWPRLPGPERTVTSLFLDLADGRRLMRNSGLDLLKARTAHTPEGWQFDAEYGRERLAGSIVPHLEDLIGVTYHDPSGQPVYCYHSELADLTLRYYTRSRRGGTWELQERIDAPASSAFEYGSVEPLPGVPLLLD